MMFVTSDIIMVMSLPTHRILIPSPKNNLLQLKHDLIKSLDW